MSPRGVQPLHGLLSAMQLLAAAGMNAPSIRSGRSHGVIVNCGSRPHASYAAAIKPAPEHACVTRIMPTARAHPLLINALRSGTHPVRATSGSWWRAGPSMRPSRTSSQRQTTLNVSRSSCDTLKAMGRSGGHVGDTLPACVHGKWGPSFCNVRLPCAAKASLQAAASPSD